MWPSAKLVLYQGDIRSPWSYLPKRCAPFCLSAPLRRYCDAAPALGVSPSGLDSHHCSPPFVTPNARCALATFLLRVVALSNSQQSYFAARTVLLRCLPQRGRHRPAIRELFHVPDICNNRCRENLALPTQLLQPTGHRVGLGGHLSLLVKSFTRSSSYSRSSYKAGTNRRKRYANPLSRSSSQQRIVAFSGSSSRGATSRIQCITHESSYP